MSYARFSAESDVYVYLDFGGYLNCCGCILGIDARLSTTAGMIDHLREHEKAGHNVPDYTFLDLAKDEKENDERMGWLG